MVLYLNDLIFTCPYCSIHFASQCQIRGTIIAQYFAQCFYNLKLNDLYIFNFATADKITPNFQFETNNLGFFRHWWKHPRGENNTSRLAYLYRVQIQCCVEGLRFTKILKLNKEKDSQCCGEGHIRIRSRTHLNCRIRIRMVTNADLKHCF